MANFKLQDDDLPASPKPAPAPPQQPAAPDNAPPPAADGNAQAAPPAARQTASTAPPRPAPRPAQPPAPGGPVPGAPMPSAPVPGAPVPGAPIPGTPAPMTPPSGNARPATQGGQRPPQYPPPPSAPAPTRPGQPPQQPAAQPPMPNAPQARQPQGGNRPMPPQQPGQPGAPRPAQPPQGGPVQRAPGQPGPGQQPPGQPAPGQQARPAPGGSPQAGPAQARAPQARPSGPPQQPGAPGRPAGPQPPAGARPVAQRPPGAGPAPGTAAPPVDGQSTAVSQAIAQAQGKAVPTLAGPATAPAPQQKARRSKVLAGVGPAWHRTLDVVEPFARWIFGVALLITAGALLMLAIGVFTGNISQIKDDAAGHKVLSDLMTASTVLRWSCIALGITGLILAFDEQAAGPLVALAGVGLTFGIPWLFRMQIGKEASDAAKYAATHIATVLMPAGYTLLAIGLLKSAIDIVIWMMGLPDRVKQRADVGVGKEAEPAQQRAARDANMFSPCWKLPFCREVIRKQCPAYLAKKRCWKFGRGCYCDEEMISRIIRGETIDVIKAPTRMSREGKAPCGRCYIYLEHQAHKYRALSPLALPITIGLMLLLWQPYQAAFKVLNDHMDVFWQRLSFEPTNFAPKAIAVDNSVVSSKDASAVGNLSPEQIGHVAMIIFGVLIGFFLLIYVSKMIEWAIYKAKL